MGAAESTTSVQNISNQLYVNRSTVNQLNETLNQVIANTIVKNAVNAGGNIFNRQEIKFEGIKVSGNFEIGDMGQTQEAKITFDAMNKTEARNDAASQFINQALTDLQKHTSTDIITQLESNAKAKATAGAGFGYSNANSEAVNVSNITSLNENVTNISNILQNRVENNFTTETVTNCVTSVNNAQNVAFVDIEVGGDFRVLNLTQEQSVEMISKCGAMTNATNKIITETLDNLGVKIDEDSTLKSVSEIKGTAESTAESKGLLEGLFGSMMLPIIIGVVVIAAIIFMYYKWFSNINKLYIVVAIAIVIFVIVLFWVLFGEAVEKEEKEETE